MKKYFRKILGGILAGIFAVWIASLIPYDRFKDHTAELKAAEAKLAEAKTEVEWCGETRCGRKLARQGGTVCKRIIGTVRAL